MLAIEYASPSKIPKVSVKINLDDEMKINTWKKIPITIVNKGAEIKNLTITNLNGDFDIRRLETIPILKENSSKTINVYLKPKALGEVPLDIEIEYEFNDKKFLKTFFFEIFVKD